MNKEGPPQFTTEWPTRGGIPHERSSCGHHGHRRSVMELYYPLLTYFLIRLRTRLSSQKMPIRVRHDLCAIGTARVGTSASLLHRSEEHTSELQSLMRISYAVFCLKKKKYKTTE